MQTVIVQAIRINGVRDVEGTATVRLSNANAAKISKLLDDKALAEFLEGKIKDAGITNIHEDKSK